MEPLNLGRKIILENKNLVVIWLATEYSKGFFLALQGHFRGFCRNTQYYEVDPIHWSG